MRDDGALSPAPAQSDAMALARRCLGGRKTWRGSVIGGFGLIRRTFVIESTGVMEGDVLVFRETLTFDDGVSQEREWRIADGEDGLSLEADGVRLTKPGRIEGDTLVFDYRLAFGGVTFAYHDRFIPDETSRDDGEAGCANVGVARLFGLRVMTIACVAVPAQD